MSTTALDNRSLTAAGVVTALAMFATSPSHAEDLTAANMLQQMSERDQYHYIAGVVAGLATARVAKDGNETGSACIQKWFFDTPGSRDTITKTFARFGDKSPSAIIYALAAKECGK